VTATAPAAASRRSTRAARPDRGSTASSHSWRRTTIVRVMVNNAFDALANPIRRGIVERLASGPSTVGAATSGFAVSKPAISRHIKVLEDAGVIERTVQGRTHRLRLNVAALNEAVAWLERQRLVWDRMFDGVEDHLCVPSARPAGTRPDGDSSRGSQ
jgi:DNA-binding transcriptional ArsR family regulator